MRAVLIALGALILASCSLPTVNAEADATAKRFYEAVRNREDLSGNTDLAENLREETRGGMGTVYRIVGTEAPKKVETRSFNFNTQAGQGTRAELLHAYVYENRTVLAETVMHQATRDGPWTIIGFHVKTENSEEPASPPPAKAEEKVTT